MKKPRKLILSRKGFDSKAGGCPSPIFLPDKTMFSLPIPSALRPGMTRYRDVHHNGLNIGDVVRDLTGGQYGRLDHAHLDPDVNRTALQQRDANWRGLFGQSNPSASGHLLNHAVGIGDVFLFFGLYQYVEKVRGKWQYVDDEPPFHALWGWLQVGGVHVRDDLGDSDFPWAHYHDHLNYPSNPYNLLFFATRDLDFGNGRIADGAGVFSRYDDSLRLTRRGRQKTQWQLPSWFHPGDDKTPLSNMGDVEWTLGDNCVYVQRKGGYGQEFVLNLDEYPEARRWVASLCRRFSSEQPA